jgi:hypothetical protein
MAEPTTPRPAESCARCRFSVEDPHAPALHCRRYPPQLIVLSSNGFTGMVSDRVSSRLPHTGSDDWCGEYQARAAEGEVARG